MEGPTGFSDDTDDDDSDYALRSFPIHDAAEEPDAVQLRAILQVKAEDADFLPGLPDSEVDLNTVDTEGHTPLHVAILHGRLECLHVLLGAGADVAKLCEGSPALHLAVSVGSLPRQQSFAADAVKALLQYGAMPYERPATLALSLSVVDAACRCMQTGRDDQGRTALHLAAEFGLAEVAALLLVKAEEMQATQQQAASAGTESQLPRLELLQDKQGNTAAHLAAFHRQPSLLDFLLYSTSAAPLLTIAMTANKAGMHPIHAAAFVGCSACCQACFLAVSRLSPATDILAMKDKRGLTASDWALKQGDQSLAQALSNGQSMQDAMQAASTNGALPDRRPAVKPTLIVAPADCFKHRTCPEPITRAGPDMPPENVNRLKVLTDPAKGILRSSGFQELKWEEGSQRGCMADILRVHDWSYVRSLQHMCASIPDIPAVVGHLDGDTAISNGTFQAALAAVGGICSAVDRVVNGEVRNAFCAIRPPGHHAGPTGVVACANDPTGSHGFCLLNNLAIAAAYAMNAHRHAGIKRVALLDFDVHHGNGTEACVAATAPSLRSFSFKTPFSEGSQTFPIFSPWLDTDDADNILFASVQGYGQKAAGIGAFVYPGSGATCDTRPASAGWPADSAAAASNPSDVDEIVEDPDNEFGADSVPKGEGPRIINVGIPGPGAHAPMWKRAWRDKILPAVARFKPDMIFVSAGFDAHKKDDINFRYIGIQEKDFEWLTEQLVSLANKYCQGRIVSALEGGYRTQGGIVSAFARSVAAHVRALSSRSLAEWSWADVRAEQQREKQRKAQLAEQERQRQQKMQATKYAQRQAAVAATVDAVNDAGTAAVSQILQTAQDAANAPPVLEDAAVRVEVSESASPTADSSSGRKRRRTTVDYVALNKQLEAEAAGASVQAAPQQARQSAPHGPNFVTNAPASTVAVHASNTAPQSVSDSPANGTALNVQQQQPVAHQPHEGDRMQ